MTYSDKKWKKGHELPHRDQERAHSMVACSGLLMSMRTSRWIQLVVKELRQILGESVQDCQERLRGGLIVRPMIYNIPTDPEGLQACLLLEPTLSTALRRVSLRRLCWICHPRYHKDNPHGVGRVVVACEPLLASLY